MRDHVVAAKEFFESNLCYVDLGEPEKTLWAACLVRAIADYIRAVHHGLFFGSASLPEYETRRKTELREIRDYFRYRSREVGSLTWICEILSDDPEALENTILNFLNSTDAKNQSSILAGSMLKQKKGACEQHKYDDIMQTG